MKRAAVCIAAVAAALLFWRSGDAPPAAVGVPLRHAVAGIAGVSRSIDAPAAFARLSAAVVEHARRDIGDGPALLDALVEERSPETALQLARALAQYEGDDALRAQTVAALRAAPQAQRVGLLSLMGRSDPDVLQLAAETLAAHGDPEAGATAAFVLHNAHADALPDKAYAAARQALREKWDGARLREEATSLLGREDATNEDVSLLEHLALTDAPAVRMRALAALDFAADPRLGEVCDTILRDDRAPERLKQMAHAWRAMHPG